MARVRASRVLCLVTRRNWACAFAFKVAIRRLAANIVLMLIQRLLALVLSSAVCSAVFAAEEAGWKNLIQGNTLDGWTQKGGKAKYRVEDGAIVGTGVPNTANSFLCTARDYTNFILELEFKVAAEFNSGVQIRSHAYDKPTEVTWKGEVIKVPAGRVHGIQVEIDPTSRAWSGGLYEEGRRKWFNTLSNNVPAQMAFKAGAWNKFHIEAIGDSYKTVLNGVPADSFKDSMDSSGFIALQVHAIGKRTNDLEVRFRNLRIKELP